MKKLIFLSLALLSNIVVAQQIVGRAYDSQANGYVVLHNVLCTDQNISTYNNQKTLYWNAQNQNGQMLNGPNGDYMQGCYFLNPQAQQVILLVPGKQPFNMPYSAFNFGQANNNGGGNVVQSVVDGLGRATTYWNNSANETQKNMQNLTPSVSGGNRGMNCTPDGRGGYNCR